MAKTIYLEGGAKGSDALNSECRRAFTKFFQAAGLKGRMPKLVACGSRNEAYDKFKTALAKGEDALLLVDSEAPVRMDTKKGQPESPWLHLKKRDKWDRPSGATDNSVHLMTQCMESWFVADRQKFIDYYSSGNRRCNAAAIPIRSDIEPLSKNDIFDWLDKATAASGRERYSKGSRSFDILATVRPQVIASTSYFLRRLLCHLDVDESWLDCSEFEEKDSAEVTEDPTNNIE